MSFDFTYGNSTINSSGGLIPTKKNAPTNPREVVDTYADIANIPNPYVGLTVTVKADETNNNKMTDYKVISLKSNNLGIADMLIDQVQRMDEYLGVSTGGSSSSGTGGAGLTAEQEERLNKIPEIETSINNINESLNSKANTSDIPTNTSELYNDSGFLTSIPSEYVTETEMNEAIANVSSGGVSQEDINTAVNNYFAEHPVQSGATEEQVAQIEANKNDITDIINNKLDGKTFKFLTQAEYNVLSESEKNNETIEYHITDAPENSHTHINKEVLDKISEDTDGSLLFNGNKINSDSTSGGITTVKYENLSTELQSLFVVIK